MYQIKAGTIVRVTGDVENFEHNLEPGTVARVKETYGRGRTVLVEVHEQGVRFVGRDDLKKIL